MMILSRVIRLPVLKRATFLTRSFTVTPFYLKKHNNTSKGKSKLTKDIGLNANSPTGTANDDIDLLEEAKTHFDKTLELHQKKINETRQGKSNSKIFDKLILPNGSKFIDVATTSSKGSHSLLITVFDPKDTKNVISTILGSGLNLNPERIPNNDQQLKVLLPPMTTETRELIIKEMKKNFEEYKSSSLKVSLGFIRNNILKKLKAIQKKNDSDRKLIADIEKLHKEYVVKLQEQFKNS
ncbi:Rrf1p NDAI_0C02150 [Naumovozyma dairenensis CBS 421]|uniref:Ribosome-recycling factor, mitochondrial n=1 Tax=Naumovozyma dairenensis (strain ATCC 10597 / BCRC 20456 / CBS 421 / NBRC 0211 / NRRL Y-12639) TaxID=1071378 RepID=G0W7W4_NAUDC|nr:hypothetical protein NDAI_0C02150 [Naumovozyma dairenensis CBS 421]CCD23875.1 hypothetical protein NDAI_0C02150 [Naumovozyma dairenensis CBS 421]